MYKTQSLKFHVGSGEVSALWVSPPQATCALVFAHGAGADMTHLFMETVSHYLADEGIATLRFNFPYMEQKRRSPDPKSVLTETIRAAITKARELTDLPILIGGKSLGGRMASWVAAEGVEGLKGLIFFGFPLHAPGKVSVERADHLRAIKVPMLFLQGTRDSLADLDSMKLVCNGLGQHANLEVIEGGDHSFKVPARSKLSYDEVLRDLAKRTKDFVKRI